MVDYRDAISAARDAVAGMELSPEQELAAFKIVLRAVLLPSAASADAEPQPTKVDAQHRPVRSGNADHGDLEKLALAADLTAENISRVFHVVEGEPPRIDIGRASLEDSKAASVRDFALLLAYSREILGATPATVEDVREVAQRHNRYDLRNFASTISKMATNRLRNRGGTLEIFSAGRIAARELIRKYADVPAESA